MSVSHFTAIAESYGSVKDVKANVSSVEHEVGFTFLVERGGDIK